MKEMNRKTVNTTKVNLVKIMKIHLDDLWLVLFINLIIFT